MQLDPCAPEPVFGIGGWQPAQNVGVEQSFLDLHGAWKGDCISDLPSQADYMLTLKTKTIFASNWLYKANKTVTLQTSHSEPQLCTVALMPLKSIAVAEL